MHLITVFFIAVGLAMDAGAVSLSSGITIENLKTKNAFLIASFFGFFQAIMPVIGWIVGYRLKNYITEVDHWIAFVLLAVIGGRMIYESIKKDNDKRIINPLNIYVLFTLAIATSIDALVIGIGFAFLNFSIVLPIIMIGLITFIVSFIGVFTGNRLGKIFAKKIEILGGVILIIIGIKILIEHLTQP